MRRRTIIGLLIALTSAAALAEPGHTPSPRVPFSKPERAERLPGAVGERAVLKLVEGSGVAVRDGRLALDPLRVTDRLTRSGVRDVELIDRVAEANAILASAGVRVERLFTRSEAELDAWRSAGESSANHELADQNLVFLLDLTAGHGSVVEVLDRLNQLDLVEYAAPMGTPDTRQSAVPAVVPDGAETPVPVRGRTFEQPAVNAAVRRISVDVQNLADAIDLASAELAVGGTIVLAWACPEGSPGCVVELDATTLLTIENAIANGRRIIDENGDPAGTSDGQVTRGDFEPSPSEDGHRAPGDELTAAAEVGPAPGDWGGVRFKSTMTSTSTFANVTIAYATNGLTIDDYSGTVSNLIVTSSSLEGIKVQGSTARPTISGVAINASGSDAIYVATGAGATVNSPTFSGNAGYAFAVDTATAPLTISGVTPPASGGNFNNAIRIRVSTIASSETWTTQSLPWVTTEDLTLPSGKNLTLPAGTVIRFATGKVFNTQGKLMTNGTGALPVRFTSNQPSPAPGHWGGLAIGYQPGYSADATLTNLIVEFAGKTTAARPAVSFYQGQLVIDSLTVRNSYGDGINSYYSGVSGSRLSVLNSAGRSMYVYGTSSNINVSNAQFVGNAQGLQVSGGPHIIDLRLAYWGNATGPSGVGPGSGDSVQQGVLYEPWLVAAPSSPNYFTSVTPKNRTLNPNVGVVAHIDHSEALVSTWAMKVFSGATLLRTQTGTGAFAEWDGRNDGGVAQPGGTYRWELSASAAGGNATAASGLAIIDPERPLIESLTVSARYFSPNGDGWKDTTTANGTIGFGDSTWTLTIKNGAQTLRTKTGSGTTASFGWDGKNTAGVLQPDGTYTAELLVTNYAASATQSADIDLDITPPTAAITSPVEDAIISNVYTAATPVRATAQDARFEGWTLEAGQGDPVNYFHLLNTGWNPLNDELATNWASSTLSVSRWTLRLTVTDLAGNLTTTSRHVDKRDFSMSQENASGGAILEFDPSSAQTVTYRSTIPFLLRERVWIENESGAVVRTLVDPEDSTKNPRTAGTYLDAWDGKDANGDLVPDGAYFHKAVVTDGPNTLTWDRSSSVLPGQPVLRFSTAGEFAPYDNKPLQASFTIANPRRIMLQVTAAESGGFGYNCTALPAVTRCVEHRYLPSGAHTLYWGGTAYGNLPFAEPRGARVAGDLFPENAVVVYGTEPVVGALTFSAPLMTPPVGTTLQTNVALEPGTTASAIVRIVRHQNGAIVRTFTVASLTSGALQIPFDGRADNQLWIPEGSYTVELTITDSIGNVVTRRAFMTARY